MRDPVGIYNPTTVAEMQKRITKLNAEIEAEGGDKAEIKLSGFVTSSGLDSKEVVVHDLDYFPKVTSLLQETDLEVLKLYSKWQILKKWALMLPKKLSLESFRFFGTVMNGIKEQKPCDVRAIRLVSEFGGNTECNILGRLYVKKFFFEEDKLRVSEMIENIREVYAGRIKNLTWMSEETKDNALKKLAKFSYKIGYPDKWGDVSKLEVQKGRLVLNLRAQSRWLWQKQLNDIGKKTDRARWRMSPQTINAYFMPPNNEIVFPAAILQPPFYNRGADDALADPAFRARGHIGAIPHGHGGWRRYDRGRGTPDRRAHRPPLYYKKEVAKSPPEKQSHYLVA
jgi:putative endopeptidase